MVYSKFRMQEFPYDRHAIMFALASRNWNGLSSTHTPAIRLFMRIADTQLWAYCPIDSEGTKHSWIMDFKMRDELKKMCDDKGLKKMKQYFYEENE
jgi:hypothetical protein